MRSPNLRPMLTRILKIAGRDQIPGSNRPGSELAGSRKQREWYLLPSPSFLDEYHSMALTDAIVVSAATAELKSKCFHTDARHLVSADSKGFECYSYGNYIR